MSHRVILVRVNRDADGGILQDVSSNRCYENANVKSDPWTTWHWIPGMMDCLQCIFAYMPVTVSRPVTNGERWPQWQMFSSSTWNVSQWCRSVFLRQKPPHWMLELTWVVVSSLKLLLTSWYLKPSDLTEPLKKGVRKQLWLMAETSFKIQSCLNQCFSSD